MSKDDELKKHMDALKFHHPGVTPEVWNSVEWRMGQMWDRGRDVGIQQMSDSLAKAQQAERERVERRYVDRDYEAEQIVDARTPEVR